MYRWKIYVHVKNEYTVLLSVKHGWISATEVIEMLTPKSQSIIFVTSAEKWLVCKIKYCCLRCVYLFKLRRLLYPYKQMLSVKTNLTRKHWCRRSSQQLWQRVGLCIWQYWLIKLFSFINLFFFSLICLLQCTKDTNFPSNASTAGLPETGLVKFLKFFKITTFLAKQSWVWFFWPLLLISSSKL